MTGGREQEEWLRQLFARKGGEAQVIEQARSLGHVVTISNTKGRWSCTCGMYGTAPGRAEKHRLRVDSDAHIRHVIGLSD